MDTKWKRSKRWIGAMAFFLGMTLLLVDIFRLTAAAAGGKMGQDIQDALQSDYQNTSAFQFYMEGYLQDFLAMASGGSVGFSWTGKQQTRGISYSRSMGTEVFGYGNVAVFGVQEGSGSSDSSITHITITSDAASGASASEATASEAGASDVSVSEAEDSDTAVAVVEERAEERRAAESAVEESTNDLQPAAGEAEKPSEEQLANNKAAADEAHEMLKECKNLLYTIVYDDEILYSNADGMTLNGEKGELPDGYNFLLYFDGQKVTIKKNGKDLNIYGDGQYRNDGGWFVPGYKNFPVDEKYGKARITIAAIDEPQLYTVAFYGNGYGYYDGGNRLYQIVQDLQETRDEMSSFFFTLAAAAIFLLVGRIFRKEKRQADRKLAFFTGKLWYEAKVLIFLIPLGFLVYQFIPMINNVYYGGLNPDIYYEYALKQIIPLELVVFWMFWLALNDACYNRHVWNNSICRRIRHSLSVRQLQYPFQRRMLLRYRKILILSAFVMVVLLVIIVAWIRGEYSYWAALTAVAVTGIVGVSAAEIRFLMQLSREARDVGDLVDQISAVREGDMEAPLYLPEDSDLYDAVTNLNEIQGGMKEAIKEQLQSERMKVELIANVSHDIKTPLTSIISYVELLKEEEELPDHVKDYISILESKSQRLKTMVQDVFEVSKAASGELPVKLDTIDFAKLLRQTLADMEEEIHSSCVTVRAQIPEEEEFIRADGQRLYRVFQNLIQNALKYSLDGSRVYIALQREDGLLTASVTNTSADELDGSIDYTARFTRGDSSRTDGGSGLGLSIARSFTEACGGTFRIDIIADLFTAYVTFKAVRPEE
ncbi:sensor histidine kinase [Eisenbergiella sp.]